MPNTTRGFDGLDMSVVWLRALERLSADGGAEPDLQIREYGSRRSFVLWPADRARRTHVYSHNIGVNSTMTEGLCRDKKLTHSILLAAGLPVVHHHLCMGSKRLGLFPPRESRWQANLAFFYEHGCDIVAKPTTGLSGDRVLRAKTPAALEAAMVTLDACPSYVLTPFVASDEEVRVMLVPELLGSTAEGDAPRVGRRAAFLLRKTGLCVKGDGKRTLAELLTDPSTPFPVGCTRAAVFADLLTSTPDLDLGDVLAPGAAFRSWKYNESKGAQFTAVHAWEGDAALEAAVRVALAAAAALGVRFGAVDVLLPSCTVLEVNTDVMLDVLELPDDHVDRILYEMLACRRALGQACAIPSCEAAGLKDAPPTMLSGHTASHDGPTAKSVAPEARPATFVEKAGLKLRSLVQVASELGLPQIRALDHDYLVILSGATPAEHDAPLPPSEADTGALRSPSKPLDLSRRVFNTNYDFGLTLALSGDITARKALTFSELSAAGIPAVPHVLFRGDRPLSSFHDLLKDGAVSLPFVLKDDTGSSGQLCSVVRSVPEAETLLLTWGHRQALAASPLLDISSEVRVIVLRGKVLLAYTKRRPVLTGNGSSTVIELIAAYASQHPSKRTFVERWIGEWPSTAAASGAAAAAPPSSHSLSLYDVPAAGASVVACWKHNLDFGADAEVLSIADDDKGAHLSASGTTLPETAIALALSACAALGLVYGAIDLVEVPSDGSSSTGDTRRRWVVLEVNACPAWNHFLSTHTAVAQRSIKAVVSTALLLQLT